MLVIPNAVRDPASYSTRSTGNVTEHNGWNG